MEQSLSNLVVNSVYRTCFKNLIGKHDRTLDDNEKLALTNCFGRLTEAYKIISPIVTNEFKTNRGTVWKRAGAEEGAEGGEGGEGGDSE